MNLQMKRVRELFGYAATLTRGTGGRGDAGAGGGFFGRRLFGKRARYWPAKSALAAQRETDCGNFPVISILTPLYNTPEPYLKAFLDSVAAQTRPALAACAGRCLGRSAFLCRQDRICPRGGR